MSSGSLLQLRSRRSRSSTPLVTNGDISGVTPQTVTTPQHNNDHHGADQYWTPVGATARQPADDHHRADQYSTPVGATARRPADASFKNDDKVSPMLAKLRMTPAGLLKEKQSLLVRKHETARQRVDNVNVGGGVSLWPDMENMRLNNQEVLQLAVLCAGLAAGVTLTFAFLHGNSMLLLLEFERNLTVFMKHHKIMTSLDQEKFDKSVILWHTSYRNILTSIHKSFDITNVPLSYMLYVLVYIVTICVLLYYLVDNMFAKSKLSPRRIKRWACLLSVSSTWTLLMAVILILAFRTELSIEHNVHLLAEELANAIPLELNCDKLYSVLLYWRTRCLPPTTSGNIAIFGILGVRDVIYYLQYYSIPIVTVLITPVFKLLMSLVAVYNVGTVT